MTPATDYDFEQLDTERPHAGVARPYVPFDPIPAAKPQRKQVLPASDDRKYWILACTWKPMQVCTIARCCGLSLGEALAQLEALEKAGKVCRVGDLWDQVR